MFTAANRANCAIYALDPRGLAAFEFDIDQGVGQQLDKASLDAGLDTLRTLADETDGRAIINSNDLVKGLAQMVKDASSYYLLGYTASSPTDGKFKQIKVRVKRPGLQVRARKGYWALSMEDVAAVTAAATRVGPAPEIGEALAQIETPLRARTIRTWIGTARGENGRTAVTLVWEPAPVAAGERREAADAAGGHGRRPERRRLFPRQGAERRRAGDRRGTASPTPATGDHRGGGRVTFQAPPGPLQLRMSVEGAAGQVLDSDFRDVVVPDYAKAEPLLSVPALYRARTQRDVNLINAARGSAAEHGARVQPHRAAARALPGLRARRRHGVADGAPAESWRQPDGRRHRAPRRGAWSGRLRGRRAPRQPAGRRLPARSGAARRAGAGQAAGRVPSHELASRSRVQRSRLQRTGRCDDMSGWSRARGRLPVDRDRLTREGWASRLRCHDAKAPAR